MNTEFTTTQKRALAVVTGIALLFGAYFLRRYFMLIVIAAIIAYLFTPVHNRLRTKLNSGLATTLTVLAALGAVVIPLIAVISLATVQISHMLIGVADWAKTADLRRTRRQSHHRPTICCANCRSRLRRSRWSRCAPTSEDRPDHRRVAAAHTSAVQPAARSGSSPRPSSSSSC